MVSNATESAHSRTTRSSGARKRDARDLTARWSAGRHAAGTCRDRWSRSRRAACIHARHSFADIGARAGTGSRDDIFGVAGAGARGAGCGSNAQDTGSEMLSA